MFKCTVTENAGMKWLRLEGRIDSLTSPELQQQLNTLILAGEHALALDFENVTFVSSACLRILVAAHKQLLRVGGRMVIYKPCADVLAVFEMSQTVRLFEIVNSLSEVEPGAGAAQPSAVTAGKWNDMAFEYVKRQAGKGSLAVIGSQAQLATASYEEKDVVLVKADTVQFGTGLATIGTTYEEYKHLFGEALILNHSFYFYPAVKRPAVDFLLGTERDPGLQYKFLYGFGFSGTCRYAVSFEGVGGLVALNDLVNCLFTISDAKTLGVVLLAESKGLMGMNLKRVPIAENKPEGGKSIFDASNFNEWMNFPVEPTHIGDIVAGAGIAVRDREQAPQALRDLLGEGTSFHIHGGIFRREPLAKEPARFEGELDRVLNELEILKVQHLLAGSRFGRGLAGIVELEG
ncbi:MAG: STAS domain-containing protein [Planctomycetota bacterium]|nr:STAS domain-containing protein [Planctomycetota bacterium]